MYAFRLQTIRGWRMTPQHRWFGYLCLLNILLCLAVLAECLILSGCF